MVKGVREYLYHKFTFGVFEHFETYQQEAINLTLPRCSKATVQIYSNKAKVDVPYTVYVKWSNGINEETVAINGRYQGEMYGKS